MSRRNSEFDLEKHSVRDINAALHAAHDGVFTIRNPGGAHALACGVKAPLDITIEGHTGYYSAGMNQLAKIRVQGNAGTGFAVNIMSGEARVTGNVSQSLGATGCGGLVVVEGSASARAGISMRGVDIVVGGDVGHMSAFMAQAGRLVVLGDAGADLGDSLYEAEIFVAGKVESLGTDCEEQELDANRLVALSDVLRRAAFDADPKSFRCFGSARRLYNFKIDNAGAG
ncbi:MAG: protein glxC [Hyphomicrobiaceae bacterium]